MAILCLLGFQSCDRYEKNCKDKCWDAFNKCFVSSITLNMVAGIDPSAVCWAQFIRCDEQCEKKADKLKYLYFL
jgi:hypothetical protein